MTARTFAFTKTTPYYRRHRELPVLTSSDELSGPADMLITRYGDQGSRYYRPWDAYYHEGKFYRIVSHVVALDEDGKPAEYTHALFDYQLDRHCSKTSQWKRTNDERFDYQLDRHCSKTSR